MNDDETKNLLRRNLELNQENNRLLRSLRRGAIIGGIFRIAWIAILIGVPIYLYFAFAEPIIGQISNTAEKVQGVGSGLDTQLSWFREMLEKFQGGEEAANSQ